MGLAMFDWKFFSAFYSCDVPGLWEETAWGKSPGKVWFFLFLKSPEPRSEAVVCLIFASLGSVYLLIYYYSELYFLFVAHTWAVCELKCFGLLLYLRCEHWIHTKRKAQRFTWIGNNPYFVLTGLTAAKHKYSGSLNFIGAQVSLRESGGEES